MGAFVLVTQDLVSLVDLFDFILGFFIPGIFIGMKLTIPAGTQPEQVFRLAGRGMPQLKSPAAKGDLYVKLTVQVPKYLSTKQRELIEEAARIKF